jgi:hypothetical protein
MEIVALVLKGQPDILNPPSLWPKGSARPRGLHTRLRGVLPFGEETP